MLNRTFTHLGIPRYALYALALGVAVPGWASFKVDLFTLKPVNADRQIVGGGATEVTEAARRVSVQGVFAPGSEVQAWADEGITFVEGFSISDGRMNFHVGPAPKQALNKVAEASAPASFRMEVRRTGSGLAMLYELPESAPVSFRILDLSGKLVHSRNLGVRQAGRHEERLSPVRLRAGTYAVRISAGKSVASQRLMIPAP